MPALALSPLVASLVSLSETPATAGGSHRKHVTPKLALFKNEEYPNTAIPKSYYSYIHDNFRKNHHQMMINQYQATSTPLPRHENATASSLQVTDIEA